MSGDGTHDHTQQDDAEIVRAAYAEKVKEAFKVFAENLGMGQNHKSSLDRFLRSLELVRKARDMALQGMSGVDAPEPKPAGEPVDEAGASTQPAAADAGLLSAEERAIVEQALAGTTGQKRPLLRR